MSLPSCKLAVVLVVCLACEGESDAPKDTVARSEFTATRYPIVLLPGIFGFEQLLGFVAYFPALPEALAEGGAEVFVVHGAQLDSSAIRAAQIIPQLEEILAITGAEKLNLIAHSQGAIDARLIASQRPELVASITSIGGPHLGARIADGLLSPLGAPLGVPLVDGLGDLFTLMSGDSYPGDGHAALADMSSAGMAAFNAQHPAGVPTVVCGQGAAEADGIHFYSWGGVAGLTNPLDLLDPLWLINGILGFEASDGMVGRCSSHFGQVIRDDYWQNHIDATNMIFGLVMPFGPRPETLYRNHANRLRNDGL